MRKRLLLTLGLVAVLGAGLFYAWLWWTTPGHRINREDFDGIRNGFEAMSYSEVVEFLGCPPRFKPRELKEFSLAGTLTSMQVEAEGYIWQSHEARLYVTFGDDGKAKGKILRPGNDEVSFLEKLRRWLRFK